MEKKLGFGIIGCGMISKWHAHAIASQKDAVLIGATSASLESAERFAAEHNCKVFPSVEDMLSSEEIDVVCICTPSGLHASMAVMAANAKKHFVVEKPMAITEAQVQDILQACQKNGVKGAVISQLRFSKAVQLVKKAIEDGVLGQILTGDVSMKYYRSPEYYASAGWRGTWEMDGGGALMNQGIHGIDVLQYLVGPVKMVFGVCKTLTRDIEVEDTASVLLEYQNGAIGTIQGTTSVTPGYPRIITISGTKGTVELTEDTITKWDVEGQEHSALVADKENFASFRNPAGFSLDSHITQIADLIDAIGNDRQPLVDVYEGKKPVDIILAAYRSSQTKMPVFLEQDDTF